MVVLTLNRDSQELIAHKIAAFLSENHSISEERRELLGKIAGDGKIDVKNLRLLQEIFADEKLSIASLIKDSKMTFPEFPKPKTVEEDPEITKRRNFLIRQQESREYNQMVHGSDVDPLTKEMYKKGESFSSTRNQLSTGLNMIASVFACAGMAYYITKQLKFEDKICLVFSVVAAILIMVVEMILFIIRATRIEQVDLKLQEKLVKDNKAKVL